jgi:hypothetical protein
MTAASTKHKSTTVSQLMQGSAFLPVVARALAGDQPDSKIDLRYTDECWTVTGGTPAVELCPLGKVILQFVTNRVEPYTSSELALDLNTEEVHEVMAYMAEQGFIKRLPNDRGYVPVVEVWTRSASAS